MNIIDALKNLDCNFKINVGTKFGHISLENCRKLPDEIKSFTVKYEQVGNFCNLFLSRECFEDLSKTWSLTTPDESISLEYGSFNPTGLPHLGNYRNLATGLLIEKILKFKSQHVQTDFYVNDAGQQVNQLTNYPDTILELNKHNLSVECRNVVTLIQKELSGIGISFDNWQFETDLYTNFKGWNHYQDILPLVQSSCGRWKCFGRFLERLDGTPTYAASDLLYALNLKTDHKVICLGTDNENQAILLRRVLEHLGIKLSLVVHESVLLDGKPLSKRAGNTVLLKDLDTDFKYLYWFFNLYNLNTKVDVSDIGRKLKLLQYETSRRKMLGNEEVILLLYKLKLNLETSNWFYKLPEVVRILISLQNVDTECTLYHNIRSEVCKILLN